ncbi:HD domain-containing protein [Lederbergia lenta]|uniref:Metal dependent phosphohydrolase n=1 Tax=Lederbergia lenta TaxID=1467 RepID=A0A2X4W7N2_LEDLE|nr:HD domain-containing protein [Lederbergia lenta]MEC2324628.1 HD domain-containing protein [Lederbergia lenta]SQI59003.1 metal dependent phosphohydrolase [Lederbergia lenta]
MNKAEIIFQTEQFVQQELKEEPSGHDWWHIYRVTKMAKKIAKQENANMFICEMAALLHDIADEKLNVIEATGIAKVRNWLLELKVDEVSKTKIIEIISTMSFKGGGQPPMKTLEGQIVQDADRLDAMGAIGIARTFVYSGSKGQIIYDPTIKSREYMTKEEYRDGMTTAINHFYEKLLKLKGIMNTNYAKKLAERKHLFMEDYLETFLSEWDGE